MTHSLIGKNLDALKGILQKIGIEDKKVNMRSKQLFSALYVGGRQQIQDITTFNADIKGRLSTEYSMERPHIVTCQTSKDGTIKWLLKTKDGQLIETVFIPEKDRGTLCISSQVGCTLNCTFCHTGTQKLVKNLSVEEIIGQIFIAKDHLKEWNQKTPKRIVTNIVLMGMGEPLYNYDNVKEAMLLAMHPDGLAFSKRRITLSTSGIVPLIAQVGADIGVNLAISLHAVTDELRNQIVPINKKYPLKDLLQACRDYPILSNSRRITFEYVMLKGINDSLEEAKQLVTLLKGIPSKINLIPFNPWPGTIYECSSKRQITKFSDYLNDHGFPSPVRATRGEDILAACGQLKSSSEKIKASIRLKNNSPQSEEKPMQPA